MHQVQIVFEDDHLLVVNKPAGMVVHPGTAHDGDDLLTILKRRPGAPQGEDLALAHRLDRDTSGLVVLGRHPAATRRLGEAMQQGQVHKLYLALAQGVTHKKGHIDVPLVDRPEGRHPAHAAPRARIEAHTRYWRMLYTRAASLLKVAPVTGRPHQIRRHLRAIHHPVAGDERWGEEGFNRWMRRNHGLERMFLHAAHLELPHPSTGATLILDAPLPAILCQVVESLGIPPLLPPWGEGPHVLSE